MLEVKRELRAFSDYLRSRGLKLTNQRREVAKQVFIRHEHFTADDLLADIRGDGLPVSKATLYRTLALMEEGGLIISLDFETGAKYYEHIIGHDEHSHIRCTRCHRIVEFGDRELKSAVGEICATRNFRLERFSLTVFGVCSRCLDRAGS